MEVFKLQIAFRLSETTMREAGAFAQKAEANGFNAFMAAENRNEPFLPLALAADRTTQIEIWTGIALAFPRSPMVTASMAFSLQDASRGRFVLGLGSQVKGHNVRRFSTPWSPPVPRMADYIRSLRAIWRCWELGEKLDFVGEHYKFTLMTPNFTPPPSCQKMVPVTIAAVGPRMVKLAGEVADGVQLHPFCTQRYLDEVILPAINAGRTKAGLSRENFHVSGGGFIVTGPNSDVISKIQELVRYRVAFYASTRSYWSVLELHGLLDLGAKLHQMSQRGQWDKMASQISDEVLDLFAVIGRHEDIVPLIEARFGRAIDQVAAFSSVDTDPELNPDLIEDIQQIPVSFKKFADRW